MTRKWFCWPAVAALISLAGILAGVLATRGTQAPSIVRPFSSLDGPSTHTDAQGRFSFAGLRSSSHLLRLDLSTLPSDIRPGGVPAVVALSPGVTQGRAVAPGVALRASYHGDGAAIDGVLFRDRDGDLHQGSDEPGVPGVRVIDPDIYQYFTPGND